LNVGRDEFLIHAASLLGLCRHHSDYRPKTALSVRPRTDGSRSEGDNSVVETLAGKCPFAPLRTLIAGLAACAGLAWPGVAAAALFSRTGPVIAIMGNELFLGEAEGHLNGAGTMTIQLQRNPLVTCQGQFTSSAELGGSGQMRCSNDDTAGTYRFRRLTLEKGYGTGSYGKRSMSFTYGLTAEESAPYLKLPPGKKLAHDGKTLVLVDIRAGGRTVSPAHLKAPDVRAPPPPWPPARPARSA
jgi:hypothetical protein